MFELEPEEKDKIANSGKADLDTYLKAATTKALEGVVGELKHLLADNLKTQTGKEYYLDEKWLVELFKYYQELKEQTK